MPYRTSIYKILEQLQVNENTGLRDDEVARRQQEYGRNELVKQKKNTVFHMFIEQFEDYRNYRFYLLKGIHGCLNHTICYRDECDHWCHTGIQGGKSN